ncbi:IclR family transcriptional regulator [Propionibacteriaceae bacterium G1746]|uniref:IclR family transcriptional regulator n=1 Tax=Aestuariimicrobium sp. G57 TaxID=3418485 RepID=UPI003C152FC5
MTSSSPGFVDEAERFEDDGRTGRSGPVERALGILEVAADRNGASARELADALDLPLPTVYRIAKELVGAGYLLHAQAGRFELGHKLHLLGMSLHRQVGLSRPVTSEIARLHEATGFAAYLAILRGGEMVIVHVVDSPDCPRLSPLRFGFHEAPHATAFGKLLLADLDPDFRGDYLERHTMVALTARTLTERSALGAELAAVARRGIAWEFGEFIPGWDCAAVPVRAGDSRLLGAVAVSAQAGRLNGRERVLESTLRAVSSRVGALLRQGN